MCEMEDVDEGARLFSEADALVSSFWVELELLPGNKRHQLHNHVINTSCSFSYG
jgi:hypothetical protein